MHIAPIPHTEEKAAEHTVDITDALTVQLPIFSSTDSVCPATNRTFGKVRKQGADRQRALEHGHGTQGGDFFRWLDACPREVHVERPGLCHDTSRLEGFFHR